MSAIIASGTLTSLTVDGVPWVATAGAGASFATLLQTAVNASKYLDWNGGDVVLTSPLVIAVPSGASDFGFDMHGAKLICGFNNAAADLITFRLAPGTNDFGYSCRVRHTQFNGAGSPSFNGSTNQCRNGLVFEALGGAASFFGVTVKSCHVYAFPNGSGVLYYGGFFESYTIDVDATNCGMGIEFRQQDLGAGGQVLSTCYVIGGDIRQCGFNTPTQGNDMGGISSTSVLPWSGSHSLAFTFVAFVNHRGPGLYLAAGALQVNCCHFEACCRDGSTPSHGAIYSFYGGVNITDCDGANPDSGNPGGQNFLVDFSGNMDTSRDHSSIERSYNVVEGGGSFARLAKLAGVSTLYIDGWSHGDSGTFSGSGTWTVRTTSYTNSTV